MVCLGSMLGSRAMSEIPSSIRHTQGSLLQNSMEVLGVWVHRKSAAHAPAPIKESASLLRLKRRT